MVVYDGRAARVLPAGEDVRRQQRFGFGEMAQAYQESMRVLRLASAEGAPFIGCAAFVAELEHYQYAAAGAHGAGYYRHEGAPPPDLVGEPGGVGPPPGATGDAVGSP